MNASASSFLEWPTPRTITGGAESAERKRELGRTDSGEGDLQAAVLDWARLWSTPRASDGEKGSPNQAFGAGGIPLSAQAVQQSGQLLFGLLDPMTGKDGAPTSSTGLMLNPQFVEPLMGWANGWTRFGCSETELSHWKAAMRSELWRLGLPPAAPPAQPSLFG